MTTRRIPICVMLLLALLATSSCQDQKRLESPLVNQLFPDVKPPAPKPAVGDITLRNATKVAMQYTVAIADEEPAERTIKPEEVYHFPQDKKVLSVGYKYDGNWAKRQIVPGQHYAFRYEASGKIGLYKGSHGRTDVADLAPFVPTPVDVAREMLDYADVEKQDVVYDIGCGDGRLPIIAAKEFGARGVGIDLDEALIAKAKDNAKKLGVEEKTTFRVEDATKSTFADATIVTLYLLSESNEIIRPQLEKQLKPGTIIVAHDYFVPGWNKRKIDVKPFKAKDGNVHYLYKYRH